MLLYLAHGTEVELEWRSDVRRSQASKDAIAEHSGHSDELHPPSSCVTLPLAHSSRTVTIFSKSTLLSCSFKMRFLKQAWELIVCGGLPALPIAKWHAAVVRSGSFNCLNSQPPTSPILQIASRPSSLLGTQRLMHHYTAINTFFHRPRSHFHFYVIIISFPPIVMGLLGTIYGHHFVCVCVCVLGRGVWFRLRSDIF